MKGVIFAYNINSILYCRALSSRPVKFCPLVFLTLLVPHKNCTCSLSPAYFRKIPVCLFPNHLSSFLTCCGLLSRAQRLGFRRIKLIFTWPTFLGEYLLVLPYYKQEHARGLKQNFIFKFERITHEKALIQQSPV